jgi:hypothetical protein
MEVIDINLSVPDQTAQQTRLKRSMIRNGKRPLRRVGGMTQANVAPALSYHFVT